MRVLGVSHLKAVIGTSAGGMQAFQWATSHSEFLDSAIDGSPGRTSSGATRPGSGRRGRCSAARPRKPSDSWSSTRTTSTGKQEPSPRSTCPHPSAGRCSGLWRRSRARLLVVVPDRDDVVDPAPALEFARLARAEVVVLDGRCGHRAPVCESGAVQSAIARFLRNGHGDARK
jgi:homoserine O-acetyltransferase